MNFLAAIFAFLGLSQVAQAAPAASTATGAAAVQDAQSIPKSGPLTQRQVELLAQKVVKNHFPNVDWKMLVCMAYIESGFNASATRNEYYSSGKLRDTSYGLMQVLLGITAPDIYSRLGARSYGAPTAQRLRDPETSLYYGAAYVNWLRRHSNTTRSAEWIVRAYNGGPGWNTTTTGRSMTLNHWNKYQAARRRFYGG